jgi:uncharacterized LabA/DUF88 family protein
MQQIAVFVDAGYLLAAGANLVANGPRPRSAITLKVDEAVKAIAKAAENAASGSRLLRIYWYDGVALHSGPTAEQTALAFASDIKLRLGTINSRGQQKGVDSLIITDLIDLSRNKAITDALLIGGDEDLRVGVQVAQTYGVRVALLGISPSRGNQSPQLLQEADVALEWDAAVVSQFLIIPELVARPEAERPQLDVPTTEGERVVDYDSVLEEILGSFNAVEIDQFKIQANSTNSLPREIDAPLLGKARDMLGRDLSVDEKRAARRIARNKLV